MSAKKHQKVAFDTVNGIFVVSGFIAIFVVAFVLIRGGSGLGFAGARKPNPGKPSVVCYDLYSPVCGRDGITYSNDCYARAAKTSVTCSGECPCAENGPGRPATPGPIKLEY